MYSLTINAILGADNLLERMVSFCSNFHRLGEGSSTSRQEHEFLERELIACMRSTIDNIESRARQDKRWLDSSEVRKVLIKGNTLLSSTCFCDSNGYTKNRIRTKFAFIRCTVELNQEVVDLFLLSDFKSRFNDLRRDYVVDVGYSLGNT